MSNMPIARAVELGYALRTLSDRKLIMIMNEHYGSRSDLPFDLRHKAGPILYRLAPDADKTAVKSAQKLLVGELKAAIREIHAKRTRKEDTPYSPWPSIEGDPSRYWRPGIPLFGKKLSMLDEKSTPYFVPEVPLLYLRVMPSSPIAALRRPEAEKFVRENATLFQPFYYDSFGGMSYALNREGSIAFNANDNAATVRDAAQLFLGREIWAFNAELLDPKHYSGGPGIPITAVENTFAKALPRYLQFLHQVLGVNPPYSVEGGAFGVENAIIFMPKNFFRKEWGPVLQNHIHWKGSVSSLEGAIINAALRKIFEAFFEAAGQERPEALYKFID